MGRKVYHRDADAAFQIPTPNSTLCLTTHGGVTYRRPKPFQAIALCGVPATLLDLEFATGFSSSNFELIRAAYACLHLQ